LVALLVGLFAHQAEMTKDLMVILSALRVEPPPRHTTRTGRIRFVTSSTHNIRISLQSSIIIDRHHLPCTYGSGKLAQLTNRVCLSNLTCASLRINGGMWLKLYQMNLLQQNIYIYVQVYRKSIFHLKRIPKVYITLVRTQ